jgi:hypothetical protein
VPPRAPIANVPKSTVAGIRWPALPSPKAAQHLALLQQLEQSRWWPAEVQRAVDLLEFKVVPHRPFTDAEEDQVRAFVHERAGDHLRVAFAYGDEIPRGPGGKFEDFKCEIDGA